jgi:hypothetical protein
VEAAHGLAERSLALARQRGERGYEAWTLQVLAEIEAQRKPDAVRPLLHQALALAEALGMRPLAERCRTVLAG